MLVPGVCAATVVRVGGETMEEGVIFHESPFGDWLQELDEPSLIFDECTWFDIGAYYATANVMRHKRSYEQRRFDRWSNVRRAKRARELDRRRGAKKQ
jgi:hypothetical protein